MKRVALGLVLVLLCVQFLGVPVLAADDDLGFIDHVGNFLGDVIRTIVNLGKSIGQWIMKGIDKLLSGLKKLFIPRDDFFKRLSDKLFHAFQSRFGGILSLANYLKERFSNLRNYRGELFVIQFPQNHLFGGARLDLLGGAGGIADLVRSALSGALMIYTVAFAYKKINAMINS